MRLIDADKLVEDFNDEQFTDWCKDMNVPLDDKSQLDGFHIGLAQGKVLLQPLSYDVDKVIEQLENQIIPVLTEFDEGNEFETLAILANQVMHIVKKGRIE